MPNTAPPTVDRHTLGNKLASFAQKAVSDYGLFLGYDGGSIEEMVSLADQVVGLKLYLDATYGELTMADPRVLSQVFEAWPGPGPIAIHGESQSIALALDLALRHGQRVHICHVPHPDDLLRIDAARQRGVRATCEITPHHLFLDTDAVARLGARAVMKPPLVPPDAVAAFWERLSLVDMVASDHAPHTRAEKAGPNPPPGVPGLETMLPLLLWAVDQGQMSIERLHDMTYAGPLRVYGLAAPADTHVQITLDAPYRLPAAGYRTRCGWSPFAGHWALGRVTEVTLRGRGLLSGGILLARPGDGRPLARAQ